MKTETDMEDLTFNWERHDRHDGGYDLWLHASKHIHFRIVLSGRSNEPVKLMINRDFVDNYTSAEAAEEVVKDEFEQLLDTCSNHMFDYHEFVGADVDEDDLP